MLSPMYSELPARCLQLYCLSTFNPLWFVAWAARCLSIVLSEHLRSVGGNHFCILLLRVSWCTCQVPPICLGSHVSLCCQMSPNVLSKHHQSVWGSYTCLLLVLDWAQLILHLSRWAAVAGLQVLLPSASNILSKYLRFVWGSHFLFSLPSVTIVLSSTFLWSHFSCSFQVSPGVCFLISSQGVTFVCQTC